MTFDEAAAYARERGWRVWSLTENSDGTWSARLHNAALARDAGKPGFSDALTDYGKGPTAGDAILRALQLRYDRQTGKVVEIELPPFSEAAEAKLAKAIERAVALRSRFSSLHLLDTTRLAAALERNAALRAALALRGRR